MSISVHSEVARLHRVLVHRPGPEIVRMTQFELEPLLFDDILSPEVAAAEHDVLREILAAEGAEVIELVDLLTGALAAAPPEAVADLLEEVCARAAVPHLGPRMAAWSPERLSAALLEGVLWDELPDAPESLARLRARLDGAPPQALAPVPNIMFLRDPCVSVFDRLLIGGMATEARGREPSLVHFALRYGDVGTPDLLLDCRDDVHPRRRSLEGGDVLVLSPQVLAIGCSERTTPETIERVVHEALFPAFPRLEVVLAVIMPARRSVMHLDTVLTQVDHALFLGHHPMIVEGHGAAVAELRRGRRPRLLEGATVLDVLRDVVDSAVRIVPCGGDDPIRQQREQWTDGANAVCVRPGHIVLYSRNTGTVRHLVDHFGFVEVALSAGDPPEARAARLAAARDLDRVVYTFVGSELSRARGGARCLTMPLERGLS